MKAETRKELAKAIKMPMCNASIFSTFEVAKRFTLRALCALMTVKVEDEYWVVSPRDASRLQKLGHEIISVYSN